MEISVLTWITRTGQLTKGILSMFCTKGRKTSLNCSNGNICETQIEESDWPIYLALIDRDQTL